VRLNRPSVHSTTYPRPVVKEGTQRNELQKVSGTVVMRVPPQNVYAQGLGGAPQPIDGVGVGRSVIGGRVVGAGGTAVIGARVVGAGVGSGVIGGRVVVVGSGVSAGREESAVAWAGVVVTGVGTALTSLSFPQPIRESPTATAASRLSTPPAVPRDRRTISSPAWPSDPYGY